MANFVKSIFLSFPALMVLALLPYGSASAQDPPVPSPFQDLYSSLDAYLTNFNATLGSGNGSTYPTLMTGSLKAANSNAGPQLLNGTMGMQLQLNALKAMGAQAIMVQVGFPVLYEPFLTSQGQSYPAFVAYYQGVAAAVRQAGLKLIVENDTLLSNDVQAGWDTAPFYATLDWTGYQQARAQTAAVVAQTMQPDYMVVVQEPNTEFGNSGQSEVDTPSGSAALLSQILASVQQSGVPGLKVGAGTATATVNALSFIQQYVTLPVDFIDMHIYPVNRGYLPNALQIASTAAAAGKPVSMTECWLWKARDSEINVLTPDQFRARDPFSFWAPLDAYFIQTMQNLANRTQMLFLDPFGAEYYFAYLPYGASTENLTVSQILGEEESAANAATQQALFTSTAMSYYNSVVVPADTAPPSAPGELSGKSANPTTAFLSWTAAADNVGVAGYYILRNGQPAGTTAALYYQDSGLTESTAYTYSIEAFDLAGNISVPSLRIGVTTADVTPPTVPGNVVATAASSQRVTLTWSASTDSGGVGSYLVFWGLSPAALIQMGRTAGTITSYTSYPLTGGTTYYYGVAADKSGNVSLMSAIVPVSTPMPPAAPASVAATAASAAKIGLTWSAAASGGLPVQYYHVFRGSSASSLSQVAAVAQTSYADVSLNPATAYYYAVEAVDTGADLSPMSAIVSATTPAPPSAPANLVATPFSTGKISLTWSAAASGGLPIQNYHVYRGTTSSNLSQVAVVMQTSYTDSTVTAGAKYYYAVAAADAGMDLSPMSAIVPVAVPSAPLAPAQLLATPVSTAKISLTWSAPASGGLPIRNYRVFRGATASNLTQVATVAQPAYTDAAGSPATRYYYAVQAADTGGDLSAMSATVSANTLALPSAPTNLAATAPFKIQVSLTWTAAQSGMPLASYTIFRGSSPSSLTSLKVAAATQTSANDTTVTPGTAYYYGIQAKDTGGNISPMSAVVAVTTPH
jgi:fibronectin type 3 domain-containing protein